VADPDRPDQRLPRTARLTTQREFRRVYGRGERATGRDLTVVLLRRRDGGHRLGVSVSKEHGSAVRRNKIKRLLREAFRLERPSLPGPFEVVLIPRPRPGKLLLASLRAELRELVSRIVAGRGRRRSPQP
jgi:ribonuclease P protein component